MSLKKEILELIELKQEGGYWDFKKEWYDESKKTDLLHDIICMSNNLANRDAYIIIGVDEKDNYQLKDIKKDSNRKNTQRIVDMLKDKPFAGSIRPTVFVQPIDYSGITIDVIVIKNSNTTPFYLNSRAKGYGVEPYNIYTRIQDTNTPINSSADLDKVEYLWRKRFGLTQTPLERLEVYLSEPENWVNSPEGEMQKYYKYFPEFTIDYRNNGDGRNGYQYYLFSQTDSSPNWHDIIIKYHQTKLTEIEGVSLDGGRYFTPVPETDGISFNNYGEWDITLKYFTKNSFRFILNTFFYRNEYNLEAEYSRDRFFDAILLFDSEEEKDAFKDYVITHKEEIDEHKKTVSIPYIPPKIDDYVENAFIEDYKHALVMRIMLDDFRRQ